MHTLGHLVQGCKAYDVDLALLTDDSLQSIKNFGCPVVFVLCSLTQDSEQTDDEFFCVIREVDGHTVGSIFWTRGFAHSSIQSLIERVYSDNSQKLQFPTVSRWCLGNQFDAGPSQTMPDIPMYVHILHACFLIGRNNNITDQELDLMLGCSHSVEKSPVLQELQALEVPLDKETMAMRKPTQPQPDNAPPRL